MADKDAVIMDHAMPLLGEWRWIPAAVTTDADPDVELEADDET